MDHVVEKTAVEASTNQLLTWSLSLAAIAIAYWYLTKPRDIPPGPLGVPIFGYLPFLGRKPYRRFVELGRKYGPIFSFYLGNRLVVVLNDYDTIKEAFIRQADIFAGRPVGLNLNFFRKKGETKSISMTDGDYWKIHRRFIAHFFRDCGMGKISMEPQLMEEILCFVDALKLTNGAATDLCNLVPLSVCNNVAFLILGKRLPYDDPWFISIKHLNDTIEKRNALNAMIAFPWLQSIPGVYRFSNKPTMLNALRKTNVMLKKLEQERASDPAPTFSYFNEFLKERRRRANYNNADNMFDDDALVQNIRTLLSAGTETTAGTILWLLIFMMLHPKVQRKAQEEVDRVIGCNRTPSFNDRGRTPYIEAVLCEVQRMRTLLPLNVPHRNTKETSVNGYRIPKNTYVISNLYAVHCDPIIWELPEMFRPERFLDPDTGAFRRPEKFVGFSLGKRQCVGEPLARVQLYLYFTTLLQHFTFQAPDGILPSLDSKCGLTLKPKTAVMCAKPRTTRAVQQVQ